MAEDKVVFDRLVIADEQGHLQGKPAEGVQQQIEQALAPLEKIPAGGANGEVLARAMVTALSWRGVLSVTVWMVSRVEMVLMALLVVMAWVSSALNRLVLAARPS